MIKIGLVQMRCEKGAITENLAGISAYITEAEELGIDILGFPEASLTGYTDPNKYPESVILSSGEEIKAVAKLTEGLNLTVLVGFIEQNPNGLPFVAQAVIKAGEVTGRYRKRTNIDEDADWFSVGKVIPLYKHGELDYGISICSDITDEEIFSESARRGAKIVFELAAPGLYGEQATRDWRGGYEWWEGTCREKLGGYAKKYGLWIAVASQAGRTVDEDFPGGGYLFAPDGKRVYATKDWQPGAVYLGIDLETGRVEEL